jgi:hypothetical protein
MAETLDVFVIQKSGEKSLWHRAGVAFQNSDGSLNVKLDLFPNVDLQIRAREEMKTNGGASKVRGSFF